MPLHNLPKTLGQTHLHRLKLGIKGGLKGGLTVSVISGLALAVAGCEPSTTSAKEQNQASVQVHGERLNEAIMNDVILVGEAIIDGQFSTTEKTNINTAITTEFKRLPQQTLDQLQPFVAAARSLHNNAAQQQTATIEQLFDDLTYTTVLEYLAPEGTHQIPTNPAELVALAQQRIGDFTQVVSDLTAKHDFRSYIFSKRAPDIAEIEKAILSVHDLAITNQLAGGANIGASFQAAAW